MERETVIDRHVGFATYPRHDRSFERFVKRSFSELGAPTEPAPLESVLRRWYPRAVVHAQDGLATFGYSVFWYVFRDGRLMVASTDAWWEEPGIAHLAFDAKGTFVEADDAAGRLLQREPSSLLGTHWSGLVPPEATGTDAAWLWDELAATGWIGSVFDLPLPDGRRRVIEYRSERTDDPDRFVTRWREVATIDPAVPVPAESG